MYTIDVKFIETKDLYRSRRDNLKITNIFWFNKGWEFDPEMKGCVYYKNDAILIWLN